MHPLEADPIEPSVPSCAQRRRGRAGLACLGVALIALLSAGWGIGTRATRGARTTADEPQYLLSAQSLIDDGDLDISNQIRERAYGPYHEVLLNPQTFPLDEAGREVSPHDPLLPVVLALPMALGGWAAAKAALALIAAAAAGTTAYFAIFRLKVRPAVTVLAVGGCFGAVALAPYGTQVYPEIVAAALVMASLCVLTAGDGPVRGASSRWPVMVACVVVVALPWLSVKYLPIAAVLAAATLYRARSDNGLIALALGSWLLGGVAFLAGHQWIYGGWTAYATGDHFTETGELSVVGTQFNVLGRTRRIVGLLVDRRFGLAPWAPIWLALPPAVAVAIRGRKPAELMAVGVVLAAWLNASFVALTMHGWWVPGRQLVVALPAAAALLASLANRSRQWSVPIAVAGSLGAINWGWLAYDASTERVTMVGDFFKTGALPYRVVSWGFPDGQRGTLWDEFGLVTWFVALALLSIVALRGTRDEAPSGPHASRQGAPW